MGKPNEKNDDKDEKPVVARTAVGLQKIKLEKLMKNPDKPVIIPERQKEKKLPHVPDFVRNVMGSSAGAGSGEFHVYRHLRRKEYARQKIIHEKSEKVQLDIDYQKKLEDNKKAAEERTAKKRAKRLKKKENLKKKKKMGDVGKKKEENESESDEDKSDEDEEMENPIQKEEGSEEKENNDGSEEGSNEKMETEEKEKTEEEDEGDVK